jgi:hypothetical protein
MYSKTVFSQHENQPIMERALIKISEALRSGSTPKGHEELAFFFSTIYLQTEALG